MMAGEGGYAMRFNALSLFILNINLEGLCQIQAKCSAFSGFEGETLNVKYFSAYIFQDQTQFLRIARCK